MKKLIFVLLISIALFHQFSFAQERDTTFLAKPQYGNTPATDFIADAPWRVQSANTKIPIIVTIKDANQNSFHLKKVKINNTKNDQEIDLYDPEPDTLINSARWEKIFDNKSASDLGISENDSLDILVEVHFTDDLNPVGLFKQYLRVYIRNDKFPSISGWYHGDTHFHSEFTDNLYEFGASVNAIAKATSAMGLDWLTITDHSCDFSPEGGFYYGYQYLQDSINKYNQYSTCKLMRGEEITVDNDNINDAVDAKNHLLAYNDDFIPGPENFMTDTRDNSGNLISISNALNFLNSSGFSYAAHPSYSLTTPLDPMIGKLEIWSDQQLDTALTFPRFKGLEIWNTRQLSKDNYNPLGEWVINPFPWYLNDVTNYDNELQRGIDLWDSLLNSRLNPVPRKILISGGSDAHGDFNYHTSNPITALLGNIVMTNDNAIAKVRTVAYCPSGLGDGNVNILNAFSNGNTIVTDGPVVVFNIDLNGDGIINQEDAIIGNDKTCLSGDIDNGKIKIQIKWKNTDEFGGAIKSMKLYYNQSAYEMVGEYGIGQVAEDEKWISLKDLRDQLGMTYQFNEYSFFRIEAFTDGRLYRCYTNPIWLKIDESKTPIIISQIQFDKITYNPNESATVTVTLADALTGATVNFTIGSSSPYTCDEVGNGVYSKIFYAPSSVGTYDVIVSASKTNYIADTKQTTLNVTNAQAGHDYKINNFTVSKTNIKPGGSVTLTATIKNNGIYAETNVPVRYRLLDPNGMIVDEATDLISLQPTYVDTRSHIFYTSDSGLTGYYTAEVRSQLSTDYDPSNDYACLSVYVGNTPKYEQYKTAYLALLKRNVSYTANGYKHTLTAMGNYTVDGITRKAAMVKVEKNDYSFSQLCIQNEVTMYDNNGYALIYLDPDQDVGVLFDYGLPAASIEVTPSELYVDAGDIGYYSVTTGNSFSGFDGNYIGIDGDTVQPWLKTGVDGLNFDIRVRVPFNATRKTYAFWLGLYSGNDDYIQKVKLIVTEPHNVSAVSISPIDGSQDTIPKLINIRGIFNNAGGYDEPNVSIKLEITGPNSYSLIQYQTMNLPKGVQDTTIFPWNTEGLIAGSYQIKLTAIISGDKYDDNTLTTIISLVNPPPPLKLSLLSPLNGDSNVSIVPTLNWEALQNISSYHLQVAADTILSNIILNDSTLITNSKTFGSLENKKKYYWRVRAKNSSGYGSFSDIWSFATIVGLPAIPQLTYPPYDTVNIPTVVTLTWKPSVDAVTYRVQVSKSITFPSTILDDSTVTVSSKEVGTLDKNTMYFWRVRAKNIAGSSSWSVVSQFKTYAIPIKQDSIKIPIQITDNYGSTINLEFGFHPNATYCVDTALGESNNLPPPGPFDPRWVDPRGKPSCFAFGMYKDFRSYRSQTQIDTFQVKLGSDSTYPITVAWESGLDAYFANYLKLIDLEGGITINVNMLNTTSVYINSSINQFRIISSGPIIDTTTDIKEVYTVLPSEYKLIQNYPNPFNPSTIIKYDLPHQATVTLTVYNTLGQRVALLVDEKQEVGYHEVTFDGARLTSGVYFYRLQAGDYLETKKLLLMK